MDSRKIEDLLSEFKRIPKVKKEVTYLEICRYPKRRFEEICSRLLSFFYQPQQEHGFGDLFLSSTLELLQRTDLMYANEEISVITEDNAEGKRIDILIHCPSFVIGIENKITASLYNPLDVYKKRIETYHKTNQIKLILSLNKIVSRNELQALVDNGFTAITYSDLFNAVKSKIGDYIVQGKQKYLVYLLDFIQTIEDMKPESQTNRRLYMFFFDKKKEIECLINAFNENKKKVLQEQIEKIEEIRSKISDKTNDKAWWAWEGWDLGYNSFSEIYKIGIESKFIETRESALGEFRIMITTWSLKNWQPFEEYLSAKYPEKTLEKIGNRAYLYVDLIKNCNDDVIIEKLTEHFNNLKEIVNKVCNKV